LEKQAVLRLKTYSKAEFQVHVPVGEAKLFQERIAYSLANVCAGEKRKKTGAYWVVKLQTGRSEGRGTFIGRQASNAPQRKEAPLPTGEGRTSPHDRREKREIRWGERKTPQRQLICVSFKKRQSRTILKESGAKETKNTNNK